MDTRGINSTVSCNNGIDLCRACICCESEWIRQISFNTIFLYLNTAVWRIHNNDLKQQCLNAVHTPRLDVSPLFTDLVAGLIGLEYFKSSNNLHLLNHWPRFTPSSCSSLNGSIASLGLMFCPAGLAGWPQVALIISWSTAVNALPAFPFQTLISVRIQVIQVPWPNSTPDPAITIKYNVWFLLTDYNLLQNIPCQIINTGSSWSSVNHFVCFCKESHLVTGIRNNYTEIANLLTDGLFCLFQSYKGISITLTLFHK